MAPLNQIPPKLSHGSILLLCIYLIDACDFKHYCGHRNVFAILFLSIKFYNLRFITPLFYIGQKSYIL